MHSGRIGRVVTVQETCDFINRSNMWIETALCGDRWHKPWP